MNGERLTRMWQLGRNRGRKGGGRFKEVGHMGTLKVLHMFCSILHFEFGTWFAMNSQLCFGEFERSAISSPARTGGVNDPRE